VIAWPESRIAELPAEVGGDGPVEVELALLGQLHHANSHGQLADRGDPDGIVGGNRASR
jgi:hypothetical protein